MATTNTPAARSAHGLAWLNGLNAGGKPRYFAAKTGGGVTSEGSTEYDGGSLIPEPVAGPATIENIVVTLRYKPGIDHTAVKALRRQVGSYTDTLNVLDTDAQFRPIPGVEPDVYPGALLVGVGGIDLDRNGTDARTCDLTFQVSVEA